MAETLLYQERVEERNRLAERIVGLDVSANAKAREFGASMRQARQEWFDKARAEEELLKRDAPALALIDGMKRTAPGGGYCAPICAVIVVVCITYLISATIAYYEPFSGDLAYDTHTIFMQCLWFLPVAAFCAAWYAMGWRQIRYNSFYKKLVAYRKDKNLDVYVGGWEQHVPANS